MWRDVPGCDGVEVYWAPDAARPLVATCRHDEWPGGDVVDAALRRAYGEVVADTLGPWVPFGQDRAQAWWY